MGYSIQDMLDDCLNKLDFQQFISNVKKIRSSNEINQYDTRVRDRFLDFISCSLSALKEEDQDYLEIVYDLLSRDYQDVTVSTVKGFVKSEVKYREIGSG